MTKRANLFPILVNKDGKPTRHEFVGFRPGLNHSVDISFAMAWYPMFRCTETGEDRAFGFLGAKANRKELYGTERRYGDDPVG